MKHVNTEIVWALGERLPKIKQSDITCHATDDISILTLLQTATTLITSRQRLTWLPALGPELTIWADEDVIKMSGLQDVIKFIMFEGTQVGVFFATYAKTGVPASLTSDQLHASELYEIYKCQNHYHVRCFSTSHLTFDKLYDNMVKHGIGCQCWMHYVLREAKRRGEFTGRIEAEGRLR